MNGMCEASADRITNLPVEVIQRIQLLLPTRRAAQMATLSTKWRRHWRSIPQLKFFAANSADQDEMMMMMNKFMFTVYKVLLLHDGPITNFKLAFGGLSPCLHNEIDQIIIYLSDRGLREFTLSFPSPDSVIYNFNFYGEFQRICFKGTPRLKEVTIFDYKHNENVETTPDMVAFFASLPTLQRFSADFKFLEYLAAGYNNVPTKLPAPLHKLKFLQICNFDFGSLRNVRAIVCLIMSSPNLFELKIQMDTELNQPATNDAVPSLVTLLEAEHCGGSGCCLQRLKVLEVAYVRGTQVELELVRFILATAPLLERVHILPCRRKLKLRKAFKFIKTMMQYKRASKEAEVIYAETYSALRR
ncbi:unnamed protein product [Linum tenue]|uniref:FBD domain-containing protein n=1 Tax=Linum tenue TaxID=586396 RepID=A0AAV0NJ72_9ROSI|nr:unnamed protein product [Linum tenue]